MVLLAGVLCAAPAQTVDWSRVVGRAAPSVATILATDGENYWNGTGFFISSDGKIATNYHVVQGAVLIHVRLENGKTFAARLLAFNSNADLAILKVNGRGFRALPLGDARSVKRGQPVCVIGSSLGYFAGSLTDGVVSAVRTGNGFTWIQITAPISSGNSGSPVLNQRGQVIGIATLSYVRGQNLNFAIGVNHLRALMASQSARPPQTVRPKAVPLGPASIKVRNAKELVSAVQRVRPGGEIILRSGEYRLTRTLTISKPIILRGAGSTKTRLVGTGTPAVLTYNGRGDFKAVGIAFCYAGQNPADVIQILSGSANLTECVISGGKARETEESTYYGRGVLIENNAVCILEHCVIKNNQSVALYAVNQSHFTLRRTRVFDNRMAGAAIDDKAICYMEQSVFRRNGIDVVAVGDSEIYAERCDLADSQAAFCFGGSAKGTLARNRVHAAQTGVHITDTASVSLEHNHIQMWKEESITLGTAIRMEEKSSCNASNNTIKSSLLPISIGGQAQISLENNLLDGSSVWICGQATFTAEKNTFRGCSIWAFGNAVARIRANQFFGTRLSGISVTDQAKTEISRNLFRDLGVAIHYASERTDGLIVDNRFRGNQVDIFLERGKQATIRNNSQENNLLGKDLVFVGVYEEWWNAQRTEGEELSINP